MLIASLYAPNGNPPGPKFIYKVAWMDRLLAHAADLFVAGVPVVLAGDYNVVPTDRDIYSDPVVRQGCVASSGNPRALRSHFRPRLDRCYSLSSSERSNVHLLELLA